MNENFAIDFTGDSESVSIEMGSAQDGDLGKNMLDQCNLNVCLVESLVDFTEKNLNSKPDFLMLSS